MGKFSSSVEKYFTRLLRSLVKFFFFNTRTEISYLQATMSCSIYYINTNEVPTILLNSFLVSKVRFIMRLTQRRKKRLKIFSLLVHGN